MKSILAILLLFVGISCAEKTTQTEVTPKKTSKIDIEAELAAIEETRAAFQLAIKENRFGDLKKYATSDVRSLDSDCGPWEPFKELRKNPTGKFHYDSLVMQPKETIIVSDSVAYDFGTSSTYYTNAEGEPIELTATFLAVLKKDKKDGRWKLHREVANTRDLE
ncbi:YybH family protein [Altibacter sp. HG106]|uniref:YybH family protein n=1 Tax=Altibacter sp. HG106 TaxID=3023937 RepID=UPI00235011F3|nr:DUF4440 domain-containing protein [Altibacter sp. HG106]MDC7995642.1 DUF4440 domain-containing protein [Altibacter sp. HG106]